MVGHLTPVKGFDRAIEAIAGMPDCELAILGDGPEHAALEALAARLGVTERVHLLGARTPDELPAFYSAADVLCIASHREGLPNVVLEALACGTPVAGVAVGGVPEAVTEPAAGALVPTNAPEDLRRALRQVLDTPHDRAATRRFAERFSWAATTAAQLELLRAAKGSRSHRV